MFEKKGVKERPDVWIVRGQNNILDKIRESLERTRTELLVAMPIVPEAVLLVASRMLVALKEKGVRVSVMVTSAVTKDSLRPLRGLADIRVREQLFGGGLISDGSRIVLLLGEEPEKGLSLAISSDHLGLVRFGKSYFEYLWDNSKPLN